MRPGLVLVAATGIALLLAACNATASTHSASRESAIHAHIQAIENSHRNDLDQVIEEFEDHRFSTRYLEQVPRQVRVTALTSMYAAARAAGDVLVNQVDDEFIVRLEGPDSFEARFRVDGDSPYLITNFAIEKISRAASDLNLTLQDLPQTLERLAQDDGLSGIVYLQIDGEVRHKSAYGIANPATGTPLRLDTMFGIGSRPIDFTIAGIMLLVQQREIDLDDRITKFFADVPSDKRGMTLRHLRDGTSGLPDFHGAPGDWDQDLAWIDRETAERRILAQPLKFAPGEDEAHSHSAFGLLAAVIERVSGQDYLEFLRQHFFKPAGMTRTGEYGALDGHDVTEFAVGGGPSSIGQPNIPPNWGKTSWLVKGSGGMYSTLDDLLRFYDFIRSGDVLEQEYATWFHGASVNVDGSDRGFELFSAYDEGGSDQAFLFVNMAVPNPLFRGLGRNLEQLVSNH